MAAMTTPVCDFGWKAIDFRLEGTDGKIHTLADCTGERGTLVMFLCNHCPFVKAVIDRIVQDVDELGRHGIGAVAIMPNDTEAYPADSFDNMKQFAAEHGFRLPLPDRPDSRDRTGLRQRVHAGLLRLRRQPRPAVPGPARRLADGAGARRAPRAPRGHDPGRRDRAGARGAAAVHGVFDQMARGRLSRVPAPRGTARQRH